MHKAVTWTAGTCKRTSEASAPLLPSVHERRNTKPTRRPYFHQNNFANLRPTCRTALGDDSGSMASTARHQALDLGLDPLAVPELIYDKADRQVLDNRPTEYFFATPRIGVAHTDAAFNERLTALYHRVLQPLSDDGNVNSVVLDLCSSSDSHLPVELSVGQVVGHGVNETELAANPVLCRYFCQDLNTRTTLPLASGSCTAVLCCNGLQYLTRPEWLMAEVHRVLAPGGVVVVAFSSCCWSDRAASGWLRRSAGERLQLVRRLLEGAGLQVLEEHVVEPPAPQDNSSASGSTGGSGGDCDPFYAFVAKRTVSRGCGEGADQASHPPGTDSKPNGGCSLTGSSIVGPALRELDVLRPIGVAEVSPLTLERWHSSYSALIADAASLGIPRSAIPPLPPTASPEEIRTARDYLQSMIDSFLSSGL